MIINKNNSHVIESFNNKLSTIPPYQEPNGLTYSTNQCMFNSDDISIKVIDGNKKVKIKLF